MEKISVLSFAKVIDKGRLFAVRTVVIYLMMGVGNVMSGDLIVLADHGGVPVSEVMKDVLGMDEREVNQIRTAELEKVRSGEYSQEALLKKMKPNFPITTTRTEGSFRSKDFSTPQYEIHRPLVLLADGPLSKRWLSKNARKLREIRSFVVVVNAKDQQVVNEISRLYGEQVSVLEDAEELLNKYHVEHLPALITQDGVYQ